MTSLGRTWTTLYALPTVSKAMATGRPSGFSTFPCQCDIWCGRRASCLRETIFLVLSITLWWYSYDPWEKFMRTECHVKTRKQYI